MVHGTREFSIRMAVLFFAGTASVDVTAQVLSQRECETNWQGQTIRGVTQVEWLPYSHPSPVASAHPRPIGRYR